MGSGFAAEIDTRPSILIVGTAHFNNPGLDMVNEDLEDVMTELRQSQISQFIEALRSYSPTHIAVEFPKTSQSQIDEAFAAYTNDQFELRNIEQHQLGYRLGRALQLDRVFGIDWNENPPGEPEFYDWYAFGQQYGFERVIEKLSDPERHNLSMAGKSITQWLRDLNSESMLLSMHRTYYDIASISANNQHPGPDWVGTWYARNLKIFNNIRELLSDGDRIVVFYGLGHAYLLNQFARESGAFQVDSLESILSN